MICCGILTMKIFATLDNDGFPTAFYPEDIHGENTPADTVEITEAQWHEFLDNQAARRWHNGKVVEFIQQIPEPEPTVIILPAVTLWERMTEEEADLVTEAVATQPVRTQRIFTTANTFRSDHELWSLLESMATQLFGEQRAAELLAI